MLFFLFILLFIVYACITSLKSNWSVLSGNGKLFRILALIIALIIFLSWFISFISDETSSSSGKSWSDLSDVEKQNAEWAYYAKEAAKNYK